MTFAGNDDNANVFIHWYKGGAHCNVLGDYKYASRR